MSVAAKVTVDTEVRTAGWTKGLQSSEKQLRDFAKNAEGALRDIKMPDVGKLAGAGIAGGIGIAAVEGFSKATEAAEQYQTAVRTGGSVQEALGKIPIAGPIVSAVGAMRELITGEKANLEETNKWADSAAVVRQTYRDIAAQQNLIGKFGADRAKAEAANSGEQERANLEEKNRELQKQIDEINLHKKEIFGANFVAGTSELAGSENLTDAQKKERAGLLKQQKANDAAITASTQKQSDQEEEIWRTKNLHVRDMEALTRQKILSADAEMQERLLRAEGKRIESIKARITMQAELEKAQLQQRLDPERMRQIGSDREREQERKDVAAEITALDKRTASGLKAAEAEEQSRRNVEGAAQEKTYSDLKSQIAIDGFKQRDAALNAFYERQGLSQRSHLAESAEIDKAYRDRIAEIEKTHAENLKGGVDDSKLYAGMINAAAHEAAVKNAGLSQSSAMEKQKNELEHAHELAKAWESTGDALKKYEGHMQDIQEQYRKLHDAKLRDAEISKLDADTLRELKSSNEDHSTKIDLYGRTSYDYIPAGHDAGDAAAQQLEIMKKQAAAAETHVPIWNNLGQWLQNAIASTGAAPVEINIGAIGG